MDDEEQLYGEEDQDSGNAPKRPTKIRDLFTDRVVGIIGGAIIPVVLLFIPLVDKYLDNAKAIQTLEIQNNTADIEIIEQRVDVLTEALIDSQLNLKKLMDKLAVAIKNLDDCQRDLKKQNP